MVIVNGIEKAYVGLNVTSMIEEMSLNPTTVVVEVNQKIIDQTNYRDHYLELGDQIEIVRFVGGG